MKHRSEPTARPARAHRTPGSLPLTPAEPSPAAAGPGTTTPPRTEAPARPASEAAESERIRQENAQLKQAIQARPVIDQARGVLMATCSCTADEAWAVLRDTSQHTNIKLRDIARAVIGGTQGIPPPEPVRTALRFAVLRARERRAKGGT
ncbi:ANTAR domain-containing protein [Streptomyces sp. NPDC002055]|uniref:ANTAR domain-containing response regulator n=1 Tax=Streptomyces sp. NPDC002055 TaxID=3154534 RepID=UPI0033299C0E